MYRVSLPIFRETRRKEKEAIMYNDTVVACHLIHLKKKKKKLLARTTHIASIFFVVYFLISFAVAAVRIFHFCL